jgi:UDP-N-acetylmuramate: L-alanyl-gamma-D-glutamyl-meso-diaminopimelate ligase
MSRIHFSGIGGTAMVAGARLAAALGFEVRGSDGPLYPPTSDMVKALGVPVAEGYAAANLDWGPDVVVIGNALSRGNPEVEAVLDRRLPYVSLPEWLKTHVLRQRRPIVVAGTHGKTTTSALTAYLLDRAGLDAGHLIGGDVLDLDASSKPGAPDAPFVIEGDEYDTAFFDKRAKFFHYLPETAIVTSIEFDHGDIYRDVEEIEVAFRRMLRQIPSNGLLLVGADDARALALREHAYSPVETYGFAENADWHCSTEPGTDGKQTLTVQRSGAIFGAFALPMAGRHNARNAVAAIASAARYGVSAEAIQEALPKFRGVRRRMDVFCTHGEITFVDDFAHHPTAIAETIGAARERWPNARLVAAFEPRTNTTRTAHFQGELAAALADADVVWIGPISRKEQLAPDEALNRVSLAASLREAHVADVVDAIVDACAGYADRETVVLLLSNGAFGGIYAMIRDRFGAS